ncbi:MAG TPA: histidinol-phosphatase [Bacteroidales bacterium]
MINYNLHQHSLFSDGKEPARKYAEKAVELGFSTIGFSEHSPLPFQNTFSLKEEKITEYIDTIEQLKTEYAGRLNIYRALEMDFIPGMSEDFNFWRKEVQADYLIGSIHLVKPDFGEELWFTDGPDYRTYDEGLNLFFEGNIQKAVAPFYHQTNRMIESQQFEILGHFDKIKMHNRSRFFTEDEKWYRRLVDETLALVKLKNLIVEVNTRGLYKKRSDSLFPDNYALQRIKELNIPVIISSDAHLSEELKMLFDFAENRLKALGFKEVMSFEKGEWNAVKI